MLKPLREYDEPKSGFVVCDIENDADGTVLAIDTAWRDDDEKIVHFNCPDWPDFWRWLLPLASAEKKYRVIYAHNGGGWDWLSLAKFLLTSGKLERDHVTASCAGSKMITMSVRIQKSVTIHFCDSLQLLRSSLDKLSAKFLGIGKVNLHGKLPHEILASNPALFRRYHRRDTESLLQVMEKSLEMIRDHVAKIDTFGMTVGSTALKVFKTIGLTQEIVVPWENEQRDFFREGYKGGRVEVFQMGYFRRVKVYDINSLYPSVMLKMEVPTSARGFWSCQEWFDRPSVYRIRYEQMDRSIPPVLMVKGEGAYSGAGVYFSPELELLRQVDPKCDLEICNGFVFTDYARIFRTYVERLYALRMQDKDGPLSLLCKYLLNSLYGKFGQHSIRERIVSIGSFVELMELVDEGAKVRDLSEDVYILEEERACNFEHVGIAGMITAGARATLYRGMLNAGLENVIYCDTDSLHLSGDLNRDLISDRIGDWKIEFAGEGVYAGKKLYALRAKDGSEKIRAKGVSVGGRNGCNLCFDDLVRIVQGEKVVCEFQQPATPIMVFSGRQEPCVFKPRKRTLRMTKNERP